MRGPGFEQFLDGMVADLNAAMRQLLASSLERAPAVEHPVLGRIYRSASAYAESGGKRMHGGAVVLAFGAVGGGPREAILPVAGALQLYHHHTLVHDDIYDEDGERRGVPTLHRALTDRFARTHPRPPQPPESGGGHVFLGPAERLGAIAGWIQGKVVHAFALDAICRAPFPPGRLLEAIRALNWHDVHDNAGQAMDIFHEGMEIPDPETCIGIARLKTGRLFGVSAELAVLLGRGSSSQARAVVDWAVSSAIAYQLQDDLEDLEEESEKGKGRGVGTDLRTCKPTLVLSLALRQASTAGRRVLEDWIRGRAGDMGRVISVLRESGATRACRAQVEALVDQATRSLQRAEPALEPGHVERMADFTRYFVSDDYWKRPLAPARHPLEPENG
jgi:geranylgeranyl diphosphate synthase type I